MYAVKTSPQGIVTDKRFLCAERNFTCFPGQWHPFQFSILSLTQPPPARPSILVFAVPGLMWLPDSNASVNDVAAGRAFTSCGCQAICGNNIKAHTRHQHDISMPGFIRLLVGIGENADLTSNIKVVTAFLKTGFYHRLGGC